MFKVKVFIMIVAFGGLFLILNPYVKLTQLMEKSRNSNKIKYILYWHKAFNYRKDFIYGLGHTPFEGCLVNNCYTTNDKNLTAVEDFDAIMFHGFVYNFKQHGKPPRRSEHQVYIYANGESPSRTRNYGPFTNYFNWTLTHR